MPTREGYYYIETWAETDAAIVQGLAAQNNAYDLAKDLYSIGQNAKAGVGSMASSGCGGTHALIPYIAFWYGAKWTADFI